MRKLLLTLAPLLFARAAAAQVIQGQVLESTTGVAVGAGFVVLLGADGKEIGRALADKDGRFTIRTPAPGSYRLRSERIGFKVSTSPVIQLAADQTLQYRLDVAAIPIRLEEIQVVAAETRCRVRPEEGRSTATVWDEARKALAAVAWMRDQQRIRIRMRTYQRQLQPDFQIVRETSQTRAGASNRSFRAVSPEQLAIRGYIESTPDGGLLFQGPDADVLFSDQFLNGHCFRLVAGDSTTAGLIGLGFEPTGGKLADIAGTMWVDEKSAELQRVEYRYVNHDLPVTSDHIGGRVEFLRLSNGAWIVSRYWIRMPKMALVKETNYTSATQVTRGGGGVTEQNRVELAGLTEEGGEVLAATAPDGTPLTESLGATLAGTVHDTTGSAPLAGAEIRLTGTPYVGTSRPDGTFELTGLPEGLYSVEFTHRNFPAWNWLAGPSPVSLRRGVTSNVNLAVPRPSTLLLNTCPTIKADREGAVAGIVRDSVTGQPVRNALVELKWREYSGSNIQLLRGQIMGTEAGTDSTGYFRSCQLPPNTPITALVLNGETEGPAVEFKVGPGDLAGVILLRVPQHPK